MQSNCPYCSKQFNPGDLVYAFHHENPVSFHAVHVKCLDGVKGKLQSTSGHRGICPSCNTDSLYIGEDTYDNLLNFSQPHLEQNEGVAISAHGASNYKPGSKENPFTIEGGGTKKIKKRLGKRLKES